MSDGMSDGLGTWVKKTEKGPVEKRTDAMIEIARLKAQNGRAVDEFHAEVFALEAEVERLKAQNKDLLRDLPKAADLMIEAAAEIRRLNKANLWWRDAHAEATASNTSMAVDVGKWIHRYHRLLESVQKPDASTEAVDIVFDGPPGPTCGRFIETEIGGAGVGIGEWVDLGDGRWALRVNVPSSEITKA